VGIFGRGRGVVTSLGPPADHGLSVTLTERDISEDHEEHRGARLRGHGPDSSTAQLPGFSLGAQSDRRRVAPRLVTWLHASYGIGAMLGPLLMTAIPAGGESLRPHASSVGLVATLGRPRVWLNISLFFVYTGSRGHRWTMGVQSLHRGSRLLPSPGWDLDRLLLGQPHGRSRRLRGSREPRLGERAPTPRDIGRTSRGLARLVRSRARNELHGVDGNGLLPGPIYPLLISETPKRLGASRATVAIGFQVAKTRSTKFIQTCTLRFPKRLPAGSPATPCRVRGRAEPRPA
jgi:hypothetical protein